MNGRDRDTAALVALQYTERISARKRDALIRRLPVPSELFTEEGATLLRTLSPEAADEFKTVSEGIDGVFDALKRAGASWVTCLDDEFPELLREIEPMPAALFVKGSVSALGGFALGVVGTRKPTRYGLKLADMFAREFARAGITVVSGFARGVDTAAHKACIEGGAPTVAVFGCGVDICYPGENRALYDAIIGGGGAVVSEYPLSTKPVSYHFPERNRLISGLSRGIFLPEAAKKSGSLITAELALEQGRDLFVTPGSVFSEESGGTNELLRSAPHALVLSPDDVLAHYRMTAAERVREGDTGQMTIEETTVIEALRRGEMHFEELIAETGLGASELSDILVNLELSGIAEQTGGNHYALC